MWGPDSSVWGCPHTGTPVYAVWTLEVRYTPHTGVSATHWSATHWSARHWRAPHTGEHHTLELHTLEHHTLERHTLERHTLECSMYVYTCISTLSKLGILERTAALTSSKLVEQVCKVAPFAGYREPVAVGAMLLALWRRMPHVTR